MARYWIIVASRDHVQTGIAEGIAQACHGKCSPLRRMHAGDGVIYYSGKQQFGQAEPCQAFTAIGEVQDEEIYQVQMSPDFIPYRRRVRYFDAREVPIRPMLQALTFIRDVQHWGAVFRYGMLEIPEQDFRMIAARMIG